MPWRLIERSEAFIWLAGLVYYTVFLFFPEPFHGKTSHFQDPMAVTGFGLVIVGILIARYVQGGFTARVEAMFASGAIQMPGYDAVTFRDWFEHLAGRIFLWVFVPMIILYVVGLTLTQSNPLGKIHLYLGGAMGAWMISARFAFGVATGFAASHISGRSSLFVLNPEHSDRSSGFGRLGYFYFDQAMVLLLPAFFMLFWIIYIGLNIAQVERNVEVNAVFEALDRPAPRETVLSQSIEEYVVCYHKGQDYYDHDSRNCGPDDRSFFWGPFFYALMIFNLVIFLLSWGWPTLLLHSRMADYRNRYIAHKVDDLERVLVDLRQRYFARLQIEPAAVVVTEMQPLMDAASTDLATYRATPVYPLPIWTALTAIISNLSAVIGLLGAAFL